MRTVNLITVRDEHYRLLGYEVRDSENVAPPAWYDALQDEDAELHAMRDAFTFANTLQITGRCLTRTI